MKLLIKKKETSILKDVLSIDLENIKKNNNDFRLLNMIIDILKKTTWFSSKRICSLFK